MVEIIGIIMVIILIITLYPYTKYKHHKNTMLPFDREKLKIK